MLQLWLDKQSHERCWYYPEVFTILSNLFGINQTIHSTLPPRCEFEEGCRLYQNEQYG